MPYTLLTPAEMGEADRLAVERSGKPSYLLMLRAGQAVADVVLNRPGDGVIDVLCGPGNNGGDGYVAARFLWEAGLKVRVWAEAAPREGSDARQAAAECPIAAAPLADYAPNPDPDSIVVDALYGAGLMRPIEGVAAAAIQAAGRSGAHVIAVDLPSGVSGATGEVLGTALKADRTVTFARKKPGHVLLPGRSFCGAIDVVDIGISDDVIAATGAKCYENVPALWRARFPEPAIDTHKYRRGHAAVVSGGPYATGAARLAALGAARAGAGAVTVLSPKAAMDVNAAHLTAVMLREAETATDIAAFIDARKVGALVYGPGLEVGEGTTGLLADLLASPHRPPALVIDASALTAFAADAAAFAELLRRHQDVGTVLTPHEGEFARMFPDIAEAQGPSKVDKARAAAKRVGAVVVYKGADTVIAEPGGRAAINAGGSPYLATAGSGDVLAGICAGLLAQGMKPFDAACAAVWIHAEAGAGFGPGLIAEDLPAALVPVLSQILRANP
ncbi:MAG: NAD(P)H-hydrate dehydratase [Rhizobiaceae bacterium]|nr:NAD(P)H-hydrate dehydratase [Rhizobiaceae bacterium]